MRPIELIPVTTTLHAMLCEKQTLFSTKYGYAPGENRALLDDICNETLALERRLKTGYPWGGYLGGSTNQKLIIGTGGFKGPPTDSGLVEIAYFIFPAFEGRGYGKAIAGSLVEIARSAGVAGVQAHTLVEGMASQAILRYHGFELLGDVRDPEDGIVLRWQLLT